MLRIAIDVREACRPKKTGKGQWTYGFVSEFLTRNVEVDLFTDSEVPAAWKHLSHVRTRELPERGWRWHIAAARIFLSDSSLDVYVSPTSYIVPFLLRHKKLCIPVVHDLIAFRGEPHDRKAQWIERLTLGRTVRSAAHICTISQSTKDDLVAQYPDLPPEKISVIYAGPMRTDPPKHQGTDRTILCVATLCPRKNQERLIRAYTSLPDDLRSSYRLLLVGSPGWHDEEILRLAQSTPGVSWKDYVPDQEYDDLLTRCAVFALPSLYEGFGMQILDALQRGIPVLTSDRGSLKEVAGDAAVFVDPENIASIADGLKKMLTDADLRENLQKKGPEQAAQFSWKRTVDAFLAIAMPSS